MEIKTRTTTGTAAVEVREAARAFARALAETTEFQAFEQTAERLRQDAPAQRSIEAYQTKQQSLQMMLQLNAVSPDDQGELEHLRQAFLAEPSVADYQQAQENLSVLCQSANDYLTHRLGLSFAASCGPGCC